MANTFVKIAAVTVGSGGASSIDFSSIPSTYTDLCIKISARRSDASEGYLSLRFNASSASDYWNRTIRGTGTAVSTSTDFNVASLDFWVLDGTGYTANTFASTDIYIPEYAGSLKKSVIAENVAEGNVSTMYMQMTSGFWNVTSAINQITLYAAAAPSGTFAEHSTAVLYGIKKN
jgi:hypothetical protein